MNQKQTGGYRPFSPTKHSPSASKSTVKRSVVGTKHGHGNGHGHGQLQNPAELHKIMSLFQ